MKKLFVPTNQCDIHQGIESLSADRQVVANRKCAACNDSGFALVHPAFGEQAGNALARVLQSIRD
jgi:hypothetical protein